MKSPFDVLPGIANPKLPFEPYPGATGVTGQVFGNTDTTYKFFWFLALLEETKTASARSDLSLDIVTLTREMVAQAWPCRRLFKLWFGHQDRLQFLIDRLAERSGLPDNARLDEVQDAAGLLSNSEVAILEDYVPYRFLTPWFRSALVGVKDHARHSLIQLLAERSAHFPRSAPYCFDAVIGPPRAISIGLKWLTFLQSNHLPLKAFAQLSLARYFEVRNPGIPGIINKLERPGVRKLVKAREFWDTILEHLPLHCIYSGEPIQPGYNLDHFLPWSFVTHDLIWNLTPAPRSVNIAKSDAVPNLERYLNAFVEQHYRASPLLKAALETTQGARFKALESVMLEYTTLFKIPAADLFQLPHDRYSQLLSTEVHAQADLARRLSFETDWVWQGAGVAGRADSR
jgi:HNH endonuclease